MSNKINSQQVRSNSVQDGEVMTNVKDRRTHKSSLSSPADTKTMDDMYRDGSDHEVCEKCGYCITCGDCKKYGCGAVADDLHELKKDSITAKNE